MMSSEMYVLLNNENQQVKLHNMMLQQEVIKLRGEVSALSEALQEQSEALQEQSQVLHEQSQKGGAHVSHIYDFSNDGLDWSEEGMYGLAHDCYDDYHYLVGI